MGREQEHQAQDAKKGTEEALGAQAAAEAERQCARQGVQEEERETVPTGKAEGLRPLPDGTQG